MTKSSKADVGVFYLNGKKVTGASPPPKSKRINLSTNFRKDIQFFCDKNGISISTLGSLAVNNGRLAERLNPGGVLLETADRIYDYMASKGFYFTNN
jgi:hypothetical protein